MNEPEGKEHMSRLLLPPKAIDIASLAPLPGVKIDPSALTKFIDTWQTSAYPESLLIKLLDNMRHIKETDFHQAVQTMAQTMSIHTKEPYIFYMPKAVGSGPFMFAQLHKYFKSLNMEPIGVLSYESGLYIPCGRPRKSSIQLVEQAKRENINFYFVDDGSYSASESQVDVSINRLIKLGINAEKIRIFTIASTTRSRNHVSKKSTSFWSYYQVPTLEEVFTLEECRALEELPDFGYNNPPKSTGRNSILTSLFYKVPDRHYGLLVKRTQNCPFILNGTPIGTQNIYPPYRK